MRKLNVAVVANCQFQTLAEAMAIFLPDMEVQGFHVRNALRNKIDLTGYDYIFIQKFNDNYGDLSEGYLSDFDNVVFIPYVIFTGFHPDYLSSISINGDAIPSPLNANAVHSKIVAFSFLSGLDEKECFKLFDPEFYKIRGYDKVFNASKENLISQLNSHELDGEFLFSKWKKNNPFVFTPVHPKHFVLVDIANELAKKIHAQYRSCKNAARFLEDHLHKAPMFPTYPGLIDQYSSGEFLFKKATKMKGGALLSLKEFIQESYSIYQEFDSLHSNFNFKESSVSKFNEDVKEFTNLNKEVLFPHPYKGLEDYNYWARSVTRLEFAEVDPIVGFTMKIDSETKVATAGSCFAQHIASTLADSGMNYYVSEPGPSALSQNESRSKGYGLFSARYGNIYTTKQLLQLFERAYGRFEPREEYWLHKDGHYIDPFRPNIGEAFTSLKQLQNDRTIHFSAVRKMFEECDVFIFTLGLTEAWTNVVDGAVYPVSPGVITDNLNYGQYRFVNFDYNEIVEDLIEFIQAFRAINPSARLILTVSPVPLIATYEDRHVLTSTTYSKSVLRSAAESISKCFAFVEYFPSYEIITGNFNGGAYFARDLREVLPSGVAHVMRLFLKHCVSQNSTQQEAQSTLVRIAKDKNLTKEINAEMQELSEVVCDEELLTR